jgi:hypothetical protein
VNFQRHGLDEGTGSDEIVEDTDHIDRCARATQSHRISHGDLKVDNVLMMKRCQAKLIVQSGDALCESVSGPADNGVEVAAVLGARRFDLTAEPSDLGIYISVVYMKIVSVYCVIEKSLKIFRK